MSINKTILSGAVALAFGSGLLGAPSLAHAQAPLTVKFVQQRGLLYLPVDMMVSGGILQKEATKLGLGKVDATVVTPPFYRKK